MKNTSYNPQITQKNIIHRLRKKILSADYADYTDYLSADYADSRRLLFKNNAFRFYGAEEQL
jgi:hypothetical protein